MLRLCLLPSNAKEAVTSSKQIFGYKLLVRGQTQLFKSTFINAVKNETNKNKIQLGFPRKGTNNLLPNT